MENWKLYVKKMQNIAKHGFNPPETTTELPGKMMPCGSPQPGRCSAFLGVRPSFREPSLAFENGGTATYEAIFCRDIPLHSPYIGLISGRYLQFRFPKWQLKICMVSFGYPKSALFTTKWDVSQVSVSHANLEVLGIRILIMWRNGPCSVLKSLRGNSICMNTLRISWNDMEWLLWARLMNMVPENDVCICMYLISGRFPWDRPFPIVEVTCWCDYSKQLLQNILYRALLTWLTWSQFPLGADYKIKIVHVYVRTLLCSPLSNLRIWSNLRDSLMIFERRKACSKTRYCLKTR